MTTLSLTDHLLRYGIGFEPLHRFATQQQQTVNNYPPYNIEQLDDDHYRLSLALAGFTRDEIHIYSERGNLTVKASKESEAPESTYLHRGIAYREFSRTWQLGEHVEVTGASLDLGLLVIDLERKIPEAARPKKIAISDHKE